MGPPLNIPRAWPGVIKDGGKARFIVLPTDQKIRCPLKGVIAHGQYRKEKSDGVFPALYCWLRLEAGLSPEAARAKAKDSLSKPGIVTVDLPAAKADASVEVSGYSGIHQTRDEAGVGINDAAEKSNAPEAEASVELTNTAPGVSRYREERLTTITVPYMSVQRGPRFTQMVPGWRDLAANPGVPFRKLSGPYEQWFRFQNGRMECGGNTKDGSGAPVQAPTEQERWLPVCGVPGIITVFDSQEKPALFFSMENCTNESVWPMMPTGEHTGRMRLFKSEKAIYVAGRGMFVHRIGDGSIPGYPCYVCGCMIPGEYDKDVTLNTVTSVKNSGDALERIIQCLGGWEENKMVRIVINS
jgi:hypothetical protein